MHIGEILRAIDAEIRAATSSVKVKTIEPAGIQLLGRQGDGWAYRILLARPLTINPDQPLTFRISGRDPIPATVVSQDDEGVVVVSPEPLPEDARLVRFTFDPTFILKALKQFLEQRRDTMPRLASALLARDIPPPAGVDPAWKKAIPATARLNASQRKAVEHLHATPIQLIWGPPGTGKTSTLGEAVAALLRTGQTILLLAPTNAAVDTLLRAVDDCCDAGDRGKIVRAGVTVDRSLLHLTTAGHVRRQDPGRISRLERLSEEIESLEESISRGYAAHVAKRLVEARTECRQIREELRQHEVSLLATTPCVAATLSKLVLARPLHGRRFDAVIVDEASMVNIPYALSAACVPGDSLCCGGDPMQLPPICQTDDVTAQRWLARNVYAWLGIDGEPRRMAREPHVFLLDTQYRMNPSIGELVSQTTYGGMLKSARDGSDFPDFEPILIDTSGYWDDTYFSVAEKSYYHPGTLALLGPLLDMLERPFLLLSPYRSQRDMLGAALLDLGLDATVGAASTVHRAQGSECRAVVVDLTAHGLESIPRFFEGDTCEMLINVALSRARDQLVIIGNGRLLKRLALVHPFWKRLLPALERSVEVIPASGLLEDAAATIVPNGALPVEAGFPVSYSHGAATEPLDPYLRMLVQTRATRKILCARQAVTATGDVIFRQDREGLPRLLLSGGRIYLPNGGRWLVAHLPRASAILAEAGFGHLVSEAVTAEDAGILVCPRCGAPTEVHRGMDGARVRCTAGAPHCFYSRGLTRDEADLRAQMQDIRCPRCNAPMTARTGPRGGLFLGCTNYPRCDGRRPIDGLEGC